MHRRALALTAVAAAALMLAACAQETSGGSSSSAPAPAPSSSAAPDSSSAAPSPTPDACAKESLATINPGTLTIGTDSPAYPPYFVDDDPSNGQGFESAVAYAVAQGLGFTPDEVTWTVVPFNKSYAPGAKDFDFDVNQISITPKRAEVVTFSDGYYTVNQAVVALTDSPIANATSLAELKNARLGAQVGTTSLQYIQDFIQPAAD
ncbi:MAG: transporter substrate-binding domain-containing protein, partial [Candidatus Nanopelagicales bacterium]